MTNLKEHFMDCRNSELVQVVKETSSSSIKRLTSEYKQCKAMGLSKYPGIRFEHLTKWKEALE